MAIIPETQYPGQTTPSSPDYPLGSAKDVTSPGSGDGTPLQEAWVNDFWGFLQSALNAGKVTASGLADTSLVSQYQQAINNITAASDPNRIITIANSIATPASNYILNPGIVWDSTKQYPIVLSTALEKVITSPWLAGDGNGAYPSTGPALADNNWYHVFAIRKADGTVDSGVDISPSAANLIADITPAGYTSISRRGAIYYRSSLIDPFEQKGNLFTPKTFRTFSLTALTSSYVSYALSSLVPGGVSLLAQLHGDIVGASGNTALTVKNTSQDRGIEICFATTGADARGIIDIITDDTQEIDARYDGAGATDFNLSVYSYREFL
jgi:hypothetical protein